MARFLLKCLSPVFKTGIETHRLLASIVESSDDAIISKDLNGIITSWNKGAERIFGYSAEEAVGRPIAILAPPGVDDMPGILEQIRQGRRVDHYETVRRRKDGQLLNVSLTVSPVRDGLGRIVGASKIARDITERKLAEETLAAQAERLARSNADLQQFAYVSAHDLQEPLRGISAMSELLQRRYGRQLDDGANELIAHVVASADRMRNLIGDLLQYSRTLDTGEKRLTRVVATEAAARWAVNNLKQAIDESAGDVQIGELPNVQGDMVNLVLLFQNLIGNAVKYRGSETPRVSVSASAQNREWLFSVADNGIGIDPAYHKQIFGMFKRLHGAQYQGTGIGLALCRRIVENHGGIIWVESEPGKGATFKFTLPMGGC